MICRRREEHNRLSESRVMIKKENIYRISILLYAVLNLVLLMHHEAWRDEAQAWTISRNLDMHEIIQLLPTEGHFLPFFLILKTWYKLGGSFAGIGYISLTIMTITVGLFFYKAPFPVWTKELIAFSPVFFYYNAVISRCYSIVALALVLTAITRKKKSENCLAYCLSIAFLMQTHILVVPLAIMLCAELIINIVTRGSDRIQIAEVCIPAGSLILAFLEVYQKNDAAFITFGTILNNFETTGLNVIRKNLETIVSWVYGTGRIYHMVIPLMILVFIAICCQIVWRIRIKKRLSPELIVCSFGIVGYLAIIAFVRPCGHIQMALVFYMLLLFAAWIMEDSHNDETLRDEKGSAISKQSFDTITKSVVAVSLVLVLLFSYKHEIMDTLFDYFHNYSNSKTMAYKVVNNLPENSMVLIRQEDTKISSPYAYIMDNRDDIVFWDVDENTEFKCIIWGKTYPDKDLSVFTAGSTENCYYLSSIKKDDIGTPILFAEDENIWDEQYYLYALTS